MKAKGKIIITIMLSILILILGVGIGSVYISPQKACGVVLYKIFGSSIGEFSTNDIAIVWGVRLPRTLLAFIVGGALSIAGVCMQSVLKNPLASSYTLGISSGSSIGAVIVITCGLSFLGTLTLPFFGMIFGVGTVMVAILFSAKIDKNLQNHTIILMGLIISFFCNGIITLFNALAKQSTQRLINWQMGSFAGKTYGDIAILFTIVLVFSFIIWYHSRELDVLTFGENEAKSIGVDVRKIKWLMLFLSSAITGTAISFVGIIGFLDLVSPHIVRKIFGNSHKVTLPMSFFVGGAFMVVCDIIARVVISPSELPIGAITALIGSPFFAYIYFKKKSGGVL